MTNRTIRQGQAPYGGQVPPSNFGALIFQEEWQEGIGNEPALGPGFQRMPARWQNWNPGLDFFLPYVEVLQQRAAIYLAAPPTDACNFQWGGVVTPFPIEAVKFEEQGGSPDHLAAYLSIFHFCGFGSLGAAYTDQQAQNQHGLIVSANDLVANPNGLFASVGMRFQRSGVFENTEYVNLGDWGSSTTPFTQQEELVSATGVLFRTDMLLSRDRATPLDPFDDETEILAMYSLDDGANWLSIGSQELKADPGIFGLPKTIGFGAAGYACAPDGDQQLNGLGACHYIRCYQQPYSITSQFINPDGGRNW